jgi:hypothetical protein
MVHISLSARVAVADGPVLPVGMELTPDTYTVSDAVLAPQGDAGDAVEIALVPDDVSLTLLAIAATVTATGKPAPVTVVPAHDATDGDAIAVNGSFLLANADVLSRLVTDGPQLFKVTNEGTTGTSVRLLAAFEV